MGRVRWGGPGLAAGSADLDHNPRRVAVCLIHALPHSERVLVPANPMAGQVSVSARPGQGKCMQTQVKPKEAEPSKGQS